MMGRRWDKVIILLIMAMVLGDSYLQADETRDEIITNLEAKAAAVNSYRGDLTMTMEMMGQKMITQGNFVFKKPNKSRMEMVTDMGAMKMKQVIISNGKTVWTYQPMMQMATKIDLEKVATETNEEAEGEKADDISKPFQSFQRESISYIRTEEIEGSKVYVFQGMPEESEMQGVPFAPANMEVWIGADYGLLRKMIMFNQEGKEMISQSYTNVEVNIEVADSQFEWTPPEGAQVMDMTEGAISTMKGEE